MIHTEGSGTPLISGQGFGDIHAEEGEGHPRQMGQRGTPNRGKRGNEVRLPYMKG